MSESIQAACGHYASQRGAAPFTTAQCFDDLKDYDDIKEVSDALGRLYRNGTLARRKIDNVRNEYVWAKFADASYEVVSKPRVVAEDDAAGATPATPFAPKKTGRPRKPQPIAATGFREEPVPAVPEIPEFLRKAPPSPQPSPLKGEEATDTPLDKGGQGGFDSAALADTLLARLGEMLAAQRRLIEARIDNALPALPDVDVTTAPGAIHINVQRVDINIRIGGDHGVD